MSFSSSGVLHSSTANGFSLTGGTAGDFILLGVLCGFTTGSTTSWATALNSNNGNVTWSVLVAHTAFSTNTGVEVLFIGQVNSTSAGTQTFTFNTGSPSLRIAWQEFSNTAGFSAVTLDTSGTIDVLTNGSFPTIAPTQGAGELYWGYLWNNGSGANGSTSGYTYQLDANGNPMAYNTSCANASQHPNIGDTNGTSGIAVLLYEHATSHAGSASLSGSGTLTASRTRVGSATLSGSGTLSASPGHVRAQSASLSGSGSLVITGSQLIPGGPESSMSGSGTLSATRKITWSRTANLSGSGTLTGIKTGIRNQSVLLTGQGTLGTGGGVVRKRGVVMTGEGTLTVLSVSGGLVAGIGGPLNPQALPGSSQVAVAPPGSGNWQWIGTLGQVTALKYGYICPGGCDRMTTTVMVPAAYRTQLFNPGWQVKIVRGGHQIWYGKLDEPQPSPQGWTLTATGVGNLGQDYVAYWAQTPWPNGEPDEIVNRAIIRGLPWVNPGLNSSPYAGQFWLGQSVDPGAQKVGEFLNLICTRGGLIWYVNSQPGGQPGNDLTVFPLPTVPNRILMITNPVGRTLGGDINTIFIRYQVTADDSTNGVSATYSTVTAVNSASVAQHGTIETFFDLSDAGTMTSAAAQAIGNQVLAIYQRASFAGPFQASYGQLLNSGGAPIDPGTDQAGTMMRAIVTDYGYGGEVVPGPINFITGAYEWDDFAQVATITPYQTADESLSGLLSAQNARLQPVAAASS